MIIIEWIKYWWHKYSWQSILIGIFSSIIAAIIVARFAAWQIKSNPIIVAPKIITIIGGAQNQTVCTVHNRDDVSYFDVCLIISSKSYDFTNLNIIDASPIHVFHIAFFMIGKDLSGNNFIQYNINSINPGETKTFKLSEKQIVRSSNRFKLNLEIAGFSKEAPQMISVPYDASKGLPKQFPLQQ